MAEIESELESPPKFDIGFKVKALVDVRNDGTYPGLAVGTPLISAGDIGYVRDIGEYLQLYHIYAIDFFERKMVVGMRGHELELVDAHSNDPK